MSVPPTVEGEKKKDEEDRTQKDGARILAKYDPKGVRSHSSAVLTSAAAQVKTGHSFTQPYFAETPWDVPPYTYKQSSIGIIIGDTTIPMKDLLVSGGTSQLKTQTLTLNPQP